MNVAAGLLVITLLLITMLFMAVAGAGIPRKDIDVGRE